MLKCLLALIAGALLPLALAPFNIYPLAFFSTAILLFLWMNASNKHSFLYGLFFGIGMFAVGSSWIYISIHQFGNAAPWLSYLITCLFILALALYPATLGWAFTGIFKRKTDTKRALFVFPSLWVLWEALRGWMFGGFPWLLLGYSQLDTPLRGWAPIIGVYGVSWIVAFISGSLVLLARRNSSLIKGICVTFMALFVLLGWGMNKIHWTKPLHKKIKVSLVQGNIPTTVKWDSNQVLNVLQTYKNLTEKHWSSKLIIWPEAAIPAFPYQVSSYLQTLTQQTRQHRSTIITGIPISDSQQNYYNGLIVLGKKPQRYLKRHLVPFGEYTPLQSIFGALMHQFNIPMSNFSPGPSNQKPLLIDHIKIAPFICYETAFPVLALNSTIGTNMVVAILDDGWFGKSIALPQQMQMSQMRALETGRPVLTSANTGITGFINPQGIIVSAAPIDKQVVLTRSVYPTVGNTPLMIWNYYPMLGLIIILLLLSLY
ncbi:MAG: apolipoprotein N-acyltransferase [Gammaproteobacteria bacterium]|nr:apolipoprotein N-acyltransferase [Gammaproteobacteria bacterium]MCH9743352.1 apolipoprotein N-acyltransferase [Gammaproteobacteria bacterium]